MTEAFGNRDSANACGAWSLLAGGAACLAASPYIALRMMPPGVLLLCAVLPAIARSRVAALGALLFAARIWMLAITASVWNTPAFGVAAPLLCIGLLLDIPAAARRAAAEKKGVPVAAAGAIIAALLMGMGLALLALRSPGNMPPHWAALLFFMAGAFCASLIPPPGIEGGSGKAQKSAVARAGAAALLAATLGCMAHVGAWLWAAEQSLARERAGNVESAMAWARLETARAGRLKFEGGVTRGLKRQALLAGACGRIEERLALNNAILRRDPKLVAPRAMAVSDALALDQYRPAYEHYRLLREDACDANASAVMLILAGSLEDWPVFLKAARRLPAGIDPAAVATLDRRRAGRGLYFEGETTLARRMLEQAAADGAADWRCARLLFFLLLDEGRNGAALEFLNGIPDEIGKPERGALERLAKGDGIAERVGAILDGTLQCLECRVEPDSGAAGGQFKMRFKWLALKPVHPGRIVFVHLQQNLYGGRMFQADHSIAAELETDADMIAVGRPFEYILNIPIPADAPAGTYTVVIGLWDGKRNLPARAAAELPGNWRISGDGRLRIGQVRVGPLAGAAGKGDAQ